MAIGHVVTGGFGISSGITGSIALVVMRGYTSNQAVTPPDSASLEWRQQGRLHYRTDSKPIHYRQHGRLQYRSEK